ncbi:MAG: hybrid sensor histidine kinase/response regulator, partial [Pseudomonadota bacterium]
MQALAQDHDTDPPIDDLGPLAWVLDELRKSLEIAVAALRRFVRESRQAQTSEGDGDGDGAVDTAQLRLARQNLHQTVGALEMVGLPAAAQLLRAMEAAVHRAIEQPQLCTEAAVSKIERAGYALIEFLEALLLGKRVTAVALFPQYREVQELAGAERVHPADLWSLEWRWQEPETPAPAQALPYAPAVRARMDQAVLRIVKAGEAAAARDLWRISIALSAGAGADAPQARSFWKLSAGFFEALSLGLLPPDVYSKRAASRVLVQYAQFAKGDTNVGERLAQDLVFFCAQAVPDATAPAPLLAAVRQAWGLDRFAPVDYLSPKFGRFEPAVLAQVRKRIAAAKEAWSAVAGGDASRLRNVGDVFRQVADSLTRLHPPTTPLAAVLTAVGEQAAQGDQLPGAELAMEVATAILYLEAAFQDLDPDAQVQIVVIVLAKKSGAAVAAE